MNLLRLTPAALLAAVLFPAASPAAAPTAADLAFYEQTVKPILAGACFECHSHEAKKFKGGLALDSTAAILKGGDTGPALVPGDVEKSLLIKAIRYTDADLQMPPKNKQLGSDQIAALEKWVKLGAPMPDSGKQVVRRGKITDEDRQWWAFVPVRKPTVPSIVISKEVISSQSGSNRAGQPPLNTQSLITNHSSAQRLDPDNQLRSRQNPRRLDAETMRDTLLAVSGKLRPHAGGKPLWPPLPEEILRAQPGVLEGLEGKDSGRRQGWYADKEDDCDVRSLYLVQKRCVPLPFLQVFDLPDTSFSCARRDVTTVAPQALNLLNSDFSLRAAKALAARVTTEVGDDAAKQIERAVWLTLGRAPSPAERQQATAFLAKHGKAALPEFCRALLNVNEFVYVD